MRSAWYVVEAKRHSEERILAHLSRRGIPAFLPLIEGHPAVPRPPREGARASIPRLPIRPWS